MSDDGVSAEALSAIRDDMREVKDALKEMSAAVLRLAVLEERHQTVAAALDRAFGAISKLGDRVREIEQALPDGAASRLRDLEQAQPVQRLTSGWVTGGVGVVAGALFMAVLKKMGVV